MNVNDLQYTKDADQLAIDYADDRFGNLLHWLAHWHAERRDVNASCITQQDVEAAWKTLHAAVCWSHADYRRWSEGVQ